jgi:hypothetical protein
MLQVGATGMRERCDAVLTELQEEHAASISREVLLFFTSLHP